MNFNNLLYGWARSGEQNHDTDTQATFKLLDMMKNLTVSSTPDSLGDKSWIENIPEIEVRIGLHCGPAAAGVLARTSSSMIYGAML